MRRLMFTLTVAVLATPAMAAEFSLSNPLISTPSIAVPFSAKDSFGQPVAPTMDSFPGENRDQNVEFQIRSDAHSGGLLPGVTVSATRSAFPSPAPLFRR